MNNSVPALVLLSVLLSSGSQIMLRLGMSSPAVQATLKSDWTLVSFLLVIAGTPAVLMGLFCFGLSALVWLFVLSKIQVSVAYPCVALGIVATVVAGRFLLGEPLSLVRCLGVLTIVVGVGIVAASR